jgi:hypothetical protein
MPARLGYVETVSEAGSLTPPKTIQRFRKAVQRPVEPLGRLGLPVATSTLSCTFNFCERKGSETFVRVAGLVTIQSGEPAAGD